MSSAACVVGDGARLQEMGDRLNPRSTATSELLGCRRSATTPTGLCGQDAGAKFNGAADPQTVSPSIPPAVVSTPPISLPSPTIHLPPSEPNIHSPSVDPNIHSPSSGPPINTVPLPISSCISRSVDNSVHCTLKRLPVSRKMAISRTSSSKSFRKVGAAGKDLEPTQRTLTSMWQQQQIPGDQSLHPRPQKPAPSVGETADTSAEQPQELHQSSLPTDMDVDSPSQPPHTIVHPCSLTPTHVIANDPLPTVTSQTHVSAFTGPPFQRTITLSPSLASAILPSQSPLDLDWTDNRCPSGSQADLFDYPLWLNDDPMLKDLLKAAREQIVGCSPNDPLRELGTLLEASSLGSLEHLRANLEELCDRRFSCGWRPTKRRYSRRLNFQNKRQLRRIQFGHIQNLYKRRRKDAASTVLDGRWRNAYLENDFKFNGFNDYWLRILRGDRITDTRPPRNLLARNDALAAPVTSGEVTKALHNMEGSAPGPDRLTPNDLRKYRPASLSALFNCLLLSGILPKSLNIARITFVPKVSVPTSPADFRPISITSVVTRCFHKILFDRWSRLFPFDRHQFGFLRRDGCFEMTSILHSTLRYCHLTSKPISFANIDISKAFDHISHDSLLRAASSFGAPPIILHYLQNVYSRGTSFFDHFSFSPQRGVRQGDPLSPLLFIMSLDEALSDSFDPNLVFHSPGGDLDYLAYADDVILFTDSREALAIRMERLQAELSSIGLSINTVKSISTHILADRHRKTTMLDNRPLSIAGTTVPSSSTSSEWQVLGIPFNWKGKLPTSAISDTSRMLDEVTQAPLKPQQRVEILRSHLIPRLIHQLTLGVVHKKTLRCIDNKVRFALRKWLRLPNDTSKAFFYSSIDTGGMGIPHLQSRIPLNRRARLNRHLATTNDLLHWALREPASQPFSRLALSNTVIGGEIVSNKQEAAAAWCKSLWNTLDGAGLRHSLTTPQAHTWLRQPDCITPSTYIRAVKLRAGVLPTKARRSRGRSSTPEQLTCRCGSGIESISHLLQTCPITHDARCRRHNEITTYIAKLLRRQHLSFLMEPQIPHLRTYIQPDLIIFKGDIVYVADIAICDPHRMVNSLKAKKDKYGSPEGDPLSPLLFIISLDGALSDSFYRNLVFHSPGGDLDYLAYADDVTLFADSRDALAIRMERLQAELNGIGPSINTGTVVPASSTFSVWQVLGISFNWKGPHLAAPTRSHPAEHIHPRRKTPRRRFPHEDPSESWQTDNARAINLSL
ncbi:uncharacterized protein DEA37_0001540 [Paragonimus westermani]|uniref:Reverse transcriptase domain-containing protein n=1 Tax=Paragonimus westermani TaxID=34504 RepID=A0A5J4NH95_9TREM|nr:uncharacterized protein DEA37_0001540 [Paragonimus westermani]